MKVTFIQGYIHSFTHNYQIINIPNALYHKFRPKKKRPFSQRVQVEHETFK